MKYLRISDLLNDESLEKIEKFLNEDPGGHKTLYLSSGGGSVDIASYLMYRFESVKDTLTLIGGEFLGSAALDLYLNYKGNKHLSKQGTIMLTHKSSFNNISNTDPSFPFYEQSCAYWDKLHSEIAKEYFTEEELNKTDNVYKFVTNEK